MKTTKENSMLNELRNVYSNNNWSDKEMYHDIAEGVEILRKENDFTDFTSKERIAIMESQVRSLMNDFRFYDNFCNKLRKSQFFMLILNGLLVGSLIGLLIKGL